MSPAWLAALSAAEDGEWIDVEQRGLVLRVRRGQMVWFARYLFEGQARRYRLGEHPEIGLSTARRLAAVARGRAAAGQDPQAERRAKRADARRRRLGERVEKAIGSWLKDQKQGPLARWRDGLNGGSARAALPHLRRLERMLGKKLLAEVTPKDVERVVLAPVAPATRNRALTAVHGFIGWAIRSGLIATDPTQGLQKEHETARTRVLSDDEICRLITGFDPTRYGRAVRLLFLTGLRRDEVLGLRWTWIDADKGVLTIPAEVEKMGERVSVAVPDLE
jgi:integrase